MAVNLHHHHQIHRVGVHKLSQKQLQLANSEPPSSSGSSEQTTPSKTKTNPLKLTLPQVQPQTPTNPHPLPTSTSKKSSGSNSIVSTKPKTALHQALPPQIPLQGNARKVLKLKAKSKSPSHQEAAVSLKAPFETPPKNQNVSQPSHSQPPTRASNQAPSPSAASNSQLPHHQLPPRRFPISFAWQASPTVAHEYVYAKEDLAIER